MGAGSATAADLASVGDTLEHSRPLAIHRSVVSALGPFTISCKPTNTLKPHKISSVCTALTIIIIIIMVAGFARCTSAAADLRQ